MREMKDKKGITLVALVITIIVLLILAGVTISLVIGDNGLLNKAENAGEEYTKSAIKEEIELAITDINAELASKTPPEGLTKQVIIDKIYDHVQETITIDSALTGDYKGYEYWIDDNYVVHMGDKITNIPMRVLLSVKRGTSYFTATVTASSKDGNIVGYIYIIDGVEKNQVAQNVYTVENLEPESTHTIKAIAIDEKGNRKESRETTIKTEARTFLYELGNEYKEITGGWTNGISVSNFNTTALTKKVEAVKNNDSISLNLIGAGYFPYTAISTVNKIDLTPYRKMKITVQVMSPTYFVDMGIANGSSFKDILEQYDTIAKRKSVSFGQSLSAGQHTIEVDISNPVTAQNYIYAVSVAGVLADVKGHIQIRSVWLEK